MEIEIFAALDIPDPQTVSAVKDDRRRVARLEAILLVKLQPMGVAVRAVLHAVHRRSLFLALVKAFGWATMEIARTALMTMVPRLTILDNAGGLRHLTDSTP